ncbi:MAG: hypothetical protein V3T24_12250, partial [Longimicrobiales bacterium]
MLALLALATATCDGDATTAPPVVGLAFDVARVELGEGRSASLGIRNTGTAAVGPIQFVPGSVVDAQGVEVGGATPSVPSGTIATLSPGESRQITAQLAVGSLPPGRYDAELN